MQNQFTNSRDEYLKLRQQFSAGDISADEFDTALQKLTVVDEQGRTWMLGANSGHWYYSAGDDWIQAEPPQNAAPKNPAPAARVSPPRPWLATIVPIVLITLMGLVVVFLYASLQNNTSSSDRL